MVVEEGQELPGRALPFAGECRWLISLDYDETLRQMPPAEPVPAAFFVCLLNFYVNSFKNHS